MKPSLAECSALVTEVMLAMRLFTTEGEAYRGESLMRWRELTEIERRYFSALVAPYHDPHAFERTQTAALNEAGDGCTITFSPPYPEPCECGRPVFIDFYTDAARCCRCLRSWPMKRHLSQGKKFETLRGDKPLAELVDRLDIGYAIERLPKESE